MTGVSQFVIEINFAAMKNLLVVRRRIIYIKISACETVYRLKAKYRGGIKPLQRISRYLICTFLRLE
jgi:hypothetical protein